MANRIESTSPGMKSQTSKRIKSTSQATLHTNPGGDNRWRPEVRFFAKTAKRIKSTSPGKTKKPKNESSLQARAPRPKRERLGPYAREASGSDTVGKLDHPTTLRIFGQKGQTNFCHKSNATSAAPQGPAYNTRIDCKTRSRRMQPPHY